MNYKNYSSQAAQKAFENDLSKDQLLVALRDYIAKYQQNNDIEYRMGMAYQFAGIMGSDLYQKDLSADPQIDQALALCGRLEIDRQPDSADWQELKAIVS